MWTCPKCGERLEGSFDACWSCGTTRAGVEIPDFVPEAVAADVGGRDVDCLRCGHALDYFGVKHFHEGARWGVLGDLAELFVRTTGFEVYVCSNCGHVELFAHGIGRG
jgi:predicted nucleic-acid-binding Zn-ribbon protein